MRRIVRIDPSPVASQKMLTFNAREINAASFVGNSASSIINHFAARACFAPQRCASDRLEKTPDANIACCNRSPKFAMRLPKSFYEGINLTHTDDFRAGNTARFRGKKWPRRPEYFRGRGFFHSPKMICIKSAPVACAMHASVTARRGASFNASSRRIVRALTLHKAAASEVRMLADFRADANRLPNNTRTSSASNAARDLPDVCRRLWRAKHRPPFLFQP